MASYYTSQQWREADAETQDYDDRAAAAAYATFVKSQNELHHTDNAALGFQTDFTPSDDVLFENRVSNNHGYFDANRRNETYFDPPGLVRQDSGRENNNPNYYVSPNTSSSVTFLSHSRRHAAAPRATIVERTDERSAERTDNRTNNRTDHDDMQQTLLLVRQRLRAQRLAEEHQAAVEQVETYGQDVTSSLAREVTMTLAEQIRSNHTPLPVPVSQSEGGGLSSAFPKREQLSAAELREDLLRRRRSQEHNSVPPLLSGLSRSRGRRERTTVESFGGMGLGEMLGSASSRMQQQNDADGGENSYTSENVTSRRTGRARANIEDFGGSLSDILQTARRNETRDENEEDITRRKRTGGRTQASAHPSARHASEWAGAGSLDDVLSASSSSFSSFSSSSSSSSSSSTSSHVISSEPVPRRRGVEAVSAADFGGSLSDVMPPVPGSRRQPAAPRQRQQRQQRQTANTATTGAMTGAVLHRNVTGSSRNPYFDNVAVTSDDRLLQEFMQSSSSSLINNYDNVVVGSSRRQQGQRGANFMREEDMTYDRLLALDESVNNRRVTVAQKSLETSPEALFKSIQTSTYRSKKKKKKKKMKKQKQKSGEEENKEEEEEEEKDEEEDECSICLCEFEHRSIGKRWPCGHFFHVKCTKELLRFDTRCPLCRYDLVTKTHG